MPFQSKAQQRYLFSKHPRVAREMADKMKEEGKSFKRLPEKVKEAGMLASNTFSGQNVSSMLKNLTNPLHPAGLTAIGGTGMLAASALKGEDKERPEEEVVTPGEKQAGMLAGVGKAARRVFGNGNTQQMAKNLVNPLHPAGMTAMGGAAMLAAAPGVEGRVKKASDVARELFYGEGMPSWLEYGVTKVAEAASSRRVGMLQKFAQGGYGEGPQPQGSYEAPLNYGQQPQQQEQQAYFPTPSDNANPADVYALPQQYDVKPSGTMYPFEQQQLARDAQISGRAGGIMLGGMGGYRAGQAVAGRLRNNPSVIGRLLGTAAGAGLGAYAGGEGLRALTNKMTDKSVYRGEDMYQQPELTPEYLQQAAYYGR
jgi:hypothetical protein